MKNLKNVPHSCKYHAEIRIETERGFNYVTAVGESIIELVEDIEMEMRLNDHRQPELEAAYLNPNTKKVDITWKIKSLIEGR